jgi:hypothetical protein
MPSSRGNRFLAEVYFWRSLAWISHELISASGVTVRRYVSIAPANNGGPVEQGILPAQTN